MGVVVYLATDLFREDSVARVQEMNKDVADSLSDQVFSVFKDSSDKMTLMAETVSQSKGKGITLDGQALIQNVLKSNDELLSFAVYSVDAKTGYSEIFFATTSEVLAEFDAKLSDLKTKPLPQLVNAIAKNPEALGIVNTSPTFKKPMLTIGFLTKESPLTHTRWLLRADLRQEPLLKLFAKRPMITAYLVDKEGNLLVHPNTQLVLNRYNVSSFPIVQRYKEAKINNEQMEFDDEQGVSFLGAYKTLGVGSTAVVAQVETGKALAAITRVQYRSLLVTAIVVGLAFILNFIFSQSMTSPLGVLFRATEKIAEGNFDVKLEPSSNDEIGALTSAFKKMATGLEERDKLKSTFSKFHSKEIASRILSGEIKLGGERKMATVFFSDIRGFTTLSETMSPDEVLGMLNEYMTEMVKVIYKHHGVVDKYVGDAIMALWGVPNAGSQDAFNAVSAALEMRSVLKDFNRKRRSRNQPEIKIGMGIHTGDVVAGNMGSEERLEYTVIGDNVNQAARIESANKECESDLLISDATCALVKSRGVVVGPAFSIRVKGKSQTLTVHQVIGVKTSQGLQTELSPAEQQAINSGSKTKVIEFSASVSTNLGSNEASASRPAIPPVPVESEWFLMRDSSQGEPEGPYSLHQLKVISGQAGFAYDRAYAFRDGDGHMTPLTQVPGLSRRTHSPNRSVNLPPPQPEMAAEAESNEWYVYGDESTTYGPYSLEQLQQALLGGNITRTTHVWSQGMDKWIYAHQVPNFDRRSSLDMPSVGTGSSPTPPMPPGIRKKIG
jgi:adenylate cyclase